MPTSPTRIVFMGTPAFATPALRALIDHAPSGDLLPNGLAIVGVVTRPDKPVGRGRQMAFSPVKQLALDAGLPVLQPGPLRRPEALATLGELAPDVIVVAAFGQILPPDVLALPPHGCLNIHASLLPRWRGASPISAAILAGDAETGVTIMRMEEGLDTGAILTQRAMPIGDDETTGALTAKLASLGAELLIETLPRWLAGEITPIPQDETQATMTRPLRKEDGRLNWSQPASSLARQIRAVSPWPGAFTTWNGRQLKVLQAHPLSALPAAAPSTPGACFTLERSDPQYRQYGPLACACGEGALALEVIQLEGKRAMPAADALRGYPALGQAILS